MGKRNPNGYGSVTKLKGNRSKPWIIKVTQYDADGNGRQVPLDYAATEEEANIILAQYNDNPWNIDRNKVTLIELYQRWTKIKLPKLGKSSQGSLKAAFKHCQKYYGMKYRNIRAYQMQDCIDNCGLSYSTQSQIKTLWGHLDNFAFECDIINKMYSQLISSPPIPDTNRTPFTTEQVDTLWRIKDDPWVNTVLIYIYTGFRLQELLGMKIEQVNITNWYFEGGIKTAAGKGRIVPIHDRIKPFVQDLVNQNSTYLFTYQGKKFSKDSYYKCWDEVMKKIGADKTPHEARHTFETNLDNANGNRKCIDMLMGHKSKDVGNRVYNHKTIEQLRETISLLK
ncbi:recombinase [Clostridiaceae bacterium AF42-6]|nr:recombinase [Clostridiaceae bacterium AF42-6]